VHIRLCLWRNKGGLVFNSQWGCPHYFVVVVAKSVRDDLLASGEKFERLKFIFSFNFYLFHGLRVSFSWIGPPLLVIPAVEGQLLRRYTIAQESEHTGL
jgi:hypothetical protein